MGSITDSVTSIKYNVYGNKYVIMEELLRALDRNFEGFESLRERFVYETPKHGNDDDYADRIMQTVLESYFKAVDGRPNTKGGCHRINLLPTTVHVYFGSLTGAMPDGRKSSELLSEGFPLSKESTRTVPPRLSSPSPKSIICEPVVPY